jgi:hypothetical protein
VIPTPRRSTVEPGLRRFTLKTSAVGASPNSFTVTLPEQGAYLLTLVLWEANKNNMASQVATCIWDAPTGNTSFMVRKSSLLGTLAISGVEISAITLSDPSTAGVLTVTLTHSHGTSVGADLVVVATQLAPASVFAQS